MTKEEILDYLREHKTIFQTKFHVKKIGLFGSYVKGEQHEASDIDIVVDMPSSFDNYYELKEMMEASLGKKIDLGFMNSMRSLIKDKIAKEIIYV